jgi:hypothetical protein
MTIQFSPGRLQPSCGSYDNARIIILQNNRMLAQIIYMPDTGMAEPLVTRTLNMSSSELDFFAGGL